ncbi:hypothetical protein CE91St41_26860 [Oscillospiraceae bacterium]|nr:hypothetical protein CE91St40_10680 [Oscillospiraceae bacterium]BDF75797.1 hypothetical protein CE91St41_26860 [Oscillospiraceae bacterium]
MRRKTSKGIQTAPMYVHSFRPTRTRKESEAKQATEIDPTTLTTTADKLRYYRHLRGLEQKEVAAHVGMYRGTYAGYEDPTARDYYPLDKLEPIAALLGVPLLDLLDDYNRFLYDGQGRQVRALRESLGLSRKELADKLGIWTSTVRDWETESVRLTATTWRKLFAQRP